VAVGIEPLREALDPERAQVLGDRGGVHGGILRLQSPPGMEIEAAEVKARLDRGERVHLVDVREAGELAICRLEGAEHIPMMQLFLGVKAPSAGKDEEVVVFCHVGVRSFEAAAFLRARGWSRALSLAGGIDAWAVSVDPTLARY
jgi:rhodanese-related sulfurtransferase